jgi:subtilisin-like proprotein convertase family protein
MPRNVLRLFALLALVLTGLSAPSLLAPATAFEPPCVVTVSNDTDMDLLDPVLIIRQPVSSSIAVADAGLVRDINIRIDIAHAADADVRAEVIHGDKIVAVINAPHQGVNFTGTQLDDEAAVALSAGVAPYTGTFRPDVPLSGFDGLAAEGTWTLSAVDVSAAGGTTGTLLGWSIIVRYADCDFDGDGLKDEVDNCPDDANATQINTDGDANGGDACDTDDDNDGRLDSADNCRTVVNTDQANNDGDSLGDICDSDDDNDLRLDTKDSCDFMYGKTVSGCPSAARTVTLSYSSGAFRGKLRCPGVQRCSAYRKVQIWRGSGRDTRLSIREARADGTFVWPRARRAGTYYALAVRGALPNVAECARAKSALLTLR